MNTSLKHHDYQYMYGLNVLSKTYNSGSGGGGFYICDVNDVVNWIFLYQEGKIHEIQIPDNTWITKHNTKYKVNQLILGPGISINDFVKKHSFEKEFVTKNSSYLRYVDEQTPELCEQAVRGAGYSIEYVKKQTKELCEIAIKNCYTAIKHVKEQTPYLCELALSHLRCESNQSYRSRK